QMGRIKHQTVSNLAQVHRALITTRLGRREAWLDQRPLRIGQVAWIAQVVAVIAGTIFGRPHRQRLPQNQAATLESQSIHPIQYLPGQTLRIIGLFLDRVLVLRRSFKSQWALASPGLEWMHGSPPDPGSRAGIEITILRGFAATQKLQP